ncbi:radixin-like isoform X2 [Hydractinia symbiolongicarpus]|uniref:radixin-like isoform X2 n=1 Tax=Hydractinia symbiolongicarpus TaxID=13093 RepID=UPI00254BAEE6|nr:radixin-like isoform X2 [Hydractinia symbiolongicarpus]
MTNNTNVRVRTMDAELDFIVEPNITGKEIFDQVVRTIGLQEFWFFGLQYTDEMGYVTWLNLNKHVAALDVKKNGLVQFKFRAKFYPENVSVELIQDVTQKLFFLQVKDNILNDRIYCSPATSVLLSSYAVQVKYGDFKSDVHRKGYLYNDRLLPDRVLKQHQMSKEQWEERIMSCWSQHRYMHREEAMMEYLKIAQDLEMYGVNYFDIKNKRGTDLYLGVDALGLNIFKRENKLSPKIVISWTEIQHISFNDKKFIITPFNKKEQEFLFYVPRLRINKRILTLCMGNLDLYMRRRKPETIEIQQMRNRAYEERRSKYREKQRLNNEQKARATAERKKHELGQQLRRLEEDARLAYEALDKSKRDTAEAEQRRRRALREAEEMHRLKEQAVAVQKRLEEEAAKERMEKAEFEAHAATAATKSARRAAEAEEKQREADRLYKELAESRQREQEQNEKLHNMTYADEQDTERTRQAVDLNFINVDQRELNYTSQQDKNENLKLQLNELSSQLNLTRDRSKLTQEDLLHEGNLKEGRDKYRTLRQIRLGNTRQRIDEFESF